MFKTDPIDAVRRDQINEHRRKTLTTNGLAHTKPVTKPKAPFVAKGHDAILERIQKDKSILEVSLQSGDTVRGFIKARDRYTVTVQTQTGAVVTVFKHAIELFAVSNTPKQGV